MMPSRPTSELSRKCIASKAWNKIRMHGGVGGKPMKRATFCCLVLSLMVTSFTKAQSKLSVKWEELTAADFRDAIQQSKGTCLLPFGILEKHGPHLPLGTDLLNVRYVSLHAAAQEYAVVFPEDYFVQILEANPQPAPLSYRLDLNATLH